MFGIGEGELAIIVVFGFLLFGPDKLPREGRKRGCC
ncbi:MAG: twin-arginine translocase TatA/TatE family subunit [Collinsella sp.]|nr:twin-arginine translocase TatA/TatE family subunit [Collinsella sp.]